MQKSIYKKKKIALLGNPNVGKSTLFNALTGLKQHTGNWTGKTVETSKGTFFTDTSEFELFDLPGTYSLTPHSEEERVTRDFILFGEYDAAVIVCDATCLERNISLVLQTIETSRKVVVCVNLTDEAEKKGIKIHYNKLSQLLGVPVVGVCARKKKTLKALTKAIENLVHLKSDYNPLKISHPETIQMVLKLLKPVFSKYKGKISDTFLSLNLIYCDEHLKNSMIKYFDNSPFDDIYVQNHIFTTKELLLANDITLNKWSKILSSSYILNAEFICTQVVSYQKPDYYEFDRKIDKIVTGKCAYPIMFLLLVFILWITITGANYPSAMLSEMFANFEKPFYDILIGLHSPIFLAKMLTFGVYRVLTWVISVMLPPMAIFFPLFTLLEDVGLLPRIAYNLDRCFKYAGSCGKQALTMCMGFGCNAAGVVGCKIIHSPKEKIIAILTNSFVPCNGRFPTLIAILTMFFVGFNENITSSFLSAVFLGLLIVLGILTTLLASKFLSTMLSNTPSSFVMELPPYRKPEFLKVLVRSLLDRTLFILGRAIIVAAPASLIIWILSNTYIGDFSILTYFSSFMAPLGHVLGLDGMILVAFILGLPANEIVLPILIMGYIGSGSLSEMESLADLRNLLVANGWTYLTAINMMIFSILHFPCSTTLLTVYKETKSLKYTAISFALPTMFGIIVCFVVTTIVRFFSL